MNMATFMRKREIVIIKKYCDKKRTGRLRSAHKQYNCYLAMQYVLKKCSLLKIEKNSS